MIEERRDIMEFPPYRLPRGKAFHGSPFPPQGSNRHRRRPILLLLFAIGLAVSGCQSARVPPGAAPESLDESAILDLLRSREESLKGVQGVADLKLSGPAGLYRGKEIFSAELPNRLRVESVNFMGFSDLVLCSDGTKMELYLPSEGKIVRGRPIPEDLAQISGARIPLPQLLRILMGHAPFSLDERITSSIYVGSNPEPRLEWKGMGGIDQCLWIDERTMAIRKGEVHEEGEVWFSFRCADYREVGGFLLPFSLDLETRKEGAKIHLAYRKIEPNPTFDEEAFRLSLPSLEGLTILDLESQRETEDLSR